jgi:hypothetical protein
MLELLLNGRCIVRTCYLRIYNQLDQLAVVCNDYDVIYRANAQTFARYRYKIVHPLPFVAAHAPCSCCVSNYLRIIDQLLAKLRYVINSYRASKNRYVYTKYSNTENIMDHSVDLFGSLNLSSWDSIMRNDLLELRERNYLRRESIVRMRNWFERRRTFNGGNKENTSLAIEGHK